MQLNNRATRLTTLSTSISPLGRTDDDLAGNHRGAGSHGAAAGRSSVLCRAGTEDQAKGGRVDFHACFFIWRNLSFTSVIRSFVPHGKCCVELQTKRPPERGLPVLL